jgi:glycosyltransferase involved in cell wall biosynthesis
VRSEDALHVVHNGVDVDVFTPRPQNPELGERWGLQGKRVVGYVGTFQPYEGLETLLQAMPRVLQDVPDARLAITGAGGVQAELERLTAALGLGSHVVFTGRVPHDQILDVYAQAEVMVYPRISTRTTRVTTPLKPLEAMAMGKAVVVSDVPAMQELIQPGQTGLTFPAGDAAALSATLITLLKDKDLRQRLGIQARADVVAKRHWPTLVARYVEIYEQALHG